jgi:hypothetical protein
VLFAHRSVFLVDWLSNPTILLGQMEEALSNQRYEALAAAKEAVEVELTKSEAHNKSLQADKVQLLTEGNRLRAHRDRLIVQKKGLRARCFFCELH